MPVLRLHAAGCCVLLFHPRPHPTLPCPGGNAPPTTDCVYCYFTYARALLCPFPGARHPLPRSTVYCCFTCVRALLCPFPGARHPLPRSPVYYYFACLRALLCPFPVAMQPLPRPAAYYHLTASALNVAPSRGHCTLCRGQPVIESFQ